MEFKDNLKNIMEAQGLKAQDVAFGIGVTRSNVYHWLKGGGIKEDVMERLAEYLKVSVNTLKFGALGFDRDAAVQIFEMIEERCDNFGVILTARQKITILHSVYHLYLETNRMPGSAVVNGYIELAR